MFNTITYTMECEGNCKVGLAVKSSLRRSNGLVKYLNEQVDSRDSWILDKLSDDDKWVYVAKFAIQKPYKGKSTIDEYTNKKGFKSMAHFTEAGGRYLGSVEKLGTKPIDRTLYEVPTKLKWTLRRGIFYRFKFP